MKNTPLIKQVFKLFSCGYFESKKNTKVKERNRNSRKFSPIELFINFVFRLIASYQNYICTMRNS